MTGVTRVALLDLRTIAPFRRQIVLAPLLVVAILFDRPEVVVPGLILLCASTTAGYPFMVSDRADLETLYAVLPVTRRTFLLGHYLWALAVFVATAGFGIAAAALLAWQRHDAFGGHTLATVVSLSWAAFAVSISVQFPLFVRFGFTRAGMLGTTLPLSIVAIAVARLHLHLTAGATLLGLLAAGGAVLLAASLATTAAIDPHRAQLDSGA